MLLRQCDNTALTNKRYIKHACVCSASGWVKCVRIGLFMRCVDVFLLRLSRCHSLLWVEGSSCCNTLFSPCDLAGCTSSPECDLSLPQDILIFHSISAGACRSMHVQRRAEACSSMREHAGARMSMQDRVGACRSMEWHAGRCRSRQEHAGTHHACNAHCRFSKPL